VCSHNRVCVEFASTQQRCFDSVAFRARTDVPAVAVQRRIEQHLAIRRVPVLVDRLVMRVLASPASGDGFRAFALSYVDEDATVAERVLAALGQAVVDAKFAPFVLPDNADLIKQEWFLDNQHGDDE
jgi:hypothetical protein